MVSRSTECPVPSCLSGPCRTAASLILAEAAEVPVGCPNRVELADPATQLPRLLSSTDLYTTPRAAELLSVRPTGGRRFNLIGPITGGSLVLLEQRVRHAIRGGGLTRAVAEPDLPPVVVVGDKTAWIKFRVVDDVTGDPIPDVKLRIRLPNGQTAEYTTRPDGMIEIDGIDPGTCDVDCPLEPLDERRLGHTLAFVATGEAPADDGTGQAEESAPKAPNLPSGELYIAEIEEHKVQTGESIASLAQNAGITWQQFALFNWDTSVPEEINEHLHFVVGCTKRTADGNNYVFDSSDDPGIVYVPRQWEARQLATDRQHVLRVRQIGGFELVVVDADDKPLAGQTVRVSQGGRDILTAVLDERGRTWVSTHQIGKPCEVDLEGYACSVMYGGLHDLEPFGEEEMSEEDLDGDECGLGDWDEDEAGDSSDVAEYLIVKGDTLSAIAARYGMNWRELYDYTGGTDIPNSEHLRSGDPDRIYVGEVIRVPG